MRVDRAASKTRQRNAKCSDSRKTKGTKAAVAVVVVVSRSSRLGVVTAGLATESLSGELASLGTVKGGLALKPISVEKRAARSTAGLPPNGPVA